ncbi:MAG: glycoside hydrolase family 3 N-terminal domain-containing protein [Sulfurospirillaceae bacterium]|nr:glycoside hydrolase family 3 N-terminal domain-containing protein [Sulfurospirillaceae bacterium]
MKKLFLLLIFSSFLISQDNQRVTPEDMIAQMIVVGFDGTKEEDKWVAQMGKDIKRGKISGVYICEKNIQSPSQIKKMSDFFYAQDKNVFIVSKQVGGKDSFFAPSKGFSEFPLASEVGATLSISEADDVYRKLSKELSSSGINLNITSVLDLYKKESTTALKDTYSSEEEIVLAYSKVFIDALRANNIVPVLAYFPGGSESDTIKEISKNWKFKELKPYYDLVSYGIVDAVMVSGAYHKKFDSLYPCTLSSYVLEKLLREKLSFGGVIVTQDLQSSQLSSFDFRKRVLKAVEAGADLLLFSTYFAEGQSVPFVVQSVIQEALSKGIIKRERLEQSYTKIMALKNKISSKRVNDVN